MSVKFMGVQLGSHSVFDEGADRCLDLLQETAGINAVFAYSTTYQGFAKGRSLGALAADHGVAPKLPSARNLTDVWFQPHEQYYAGTILRHRRPAPTEDYAGRDVLAELVEPCRKRGMKLYARILEGHGARLASTMDNWPKILTIDVYGRPTALPCWNNPDYRNWWLSTVEDLFKSYPLDGFKYGAERSGPLPNLFANGDVPGCFCAHCCARGREKGINVERARQGFQQLYEFISGLRAGKDVPADGALVTVLRILLRYPEILAWEYQWHQAKEEVARQMYGTIKLINPQAQVGWHIYHWVGWQAIYRAEMDYAEMVSYSDWLKPVVYHDIAGPRIRNMHIGRLHTSVLKDMSEEQSLGLLYAIMGYDAKKEPGLDELDSKGLSPDYVYRETKRCVDAVEGKIPVYPGVGFDIPGHDGEHFPSDTETLYRATYRAFEAGAKGLIVSREYDEMRVENLRAVGRAVRDATTTGL